MSNHTTPEGIMQTKDETYNGYTNYETWAVGLYLDGNYDGEGTYRFVLDLVRESVEMWVDEPTRLYQATSALEQWTRDMIADDNIEGIARDLLCAALDSVNWRELAEAKLAEVAEADDES